jgi:hypothetical protein
MPFFFIATLTLRKCSFCKKESKTNQQDQHQLEDPLKHEELTQTIVTV